MVRTVRSPVVHRCGLGSVERRDFLTLLTGGMVAALTGCTGGGESSPYPDDTGSETRARVAFAFD